MKLNKYNKSTEKSQNAAIMAAASSPSSNGSNSGSYSSGGRNLWGNDDTGNDINESITVQGDVTAEKIADEGTGEQSGGSLISNSHVYFPYPNENSGRQDLAPLIKSLETKIEQLNVTKGLTRAEVIALINQYAGTGGNTPEKADPYGSPTEPIVMLSGVIKKVSASEWEFTGASRCIYEVTCVVDNGVMNVTLRPYLDVAELFILSSSITQEGAGAIGTPSVIQGRGLGAHWFQSSVSTNRVNGNVIVRIRELHQGNGNNDTWVSQQWNSDDGVNAIQITLFGYATIRSLSMEVDAEGTQTE